MENKGQQVVHCKKCGGNKVQELNFKAGVTFMGFMLFGLGVWIPFFGWLIMCPAGLIMFVLGIMSLFVKSKNKAFKCQECKHTFNVPMETYSEYKAALK